MIKKQFFAVSNIELCKTCEKCCIGELSGNGVCKFYTSTGCCLPLENRDPACRMFPFVIMKDMRFKNPHRVFIDLACPYWYEFVSIADVIKESTEYTITVYMKPD